MQRAPLTSSGKYKHWSPEPAPPLASIDGPLLRPPFNAPDLVHMIVLIVRLIMTMEMMMMMTWWLSYLPPKSPW